MAAAGLRNAHDEIVSLISELEAACREAVPDRSRLANIRWRLSRASARRFRLLEDNIYPNLAQRLAAPEAERVSALRESNAAMLAASREHVGNWSIDKIMADWTGYCAASATMRELMRARVAREREILYPLLDSSGAG